MDPIQLVGGAQGLKNVANVLRAEGVAIDAIYLVKLVDNDERSRWIVRLVSRQPSEEVLHEVFALRREGKLPRYGLSIILDAVSPDDPEASRIMGHARDYGRVPIEFESVILDGKLIDYALVADYPGASAAAA